MITCLILGDIACLVGFQFLPNKNHDMAKLRLTKIKARQS